MSLKRAQREQFSQSNKNRVYSLLKVCPSKRAAQVSINPLDQAQVKFIIQPEILLVLHFRPTPANHNLRLNRAYPIILNFIEEAIRGIS